MSDGTIWIQSTPFVADGDPVNAASINAPLNALDERTHALRRMLDALQAGEQLVLREAPLDAGVESGQVVYFDTVNLRFTGALAQWQSVENSPRAFPAPSAVHTGIVFNRVGAYTGDILVGGFLPLTDAQLTALFGTSSPERGLYWLSMQTPGTVVQTPPDMPVKTLLYMGSGVVQIFQPQAETLRHTHRDFRLHAGVWLPASNFTESIVPAGTTFGYNLLDPSSVADNLVNALLPSVGEPLFVWAYPARESSSSSSAGPPCQDQEGVYGRHVDDQCITMDRNGIWWSGEAVPSSDILMQVVSADVRGLSLIHAMRNLTPARLQLSEKDGVVSIGVRSPELDDSLTDTGYMVVKQLDNWVQKRGPVCSGVRPGRGLRASAPVTQTGGFYAGPVTIELALYHNVHIDASLQNLNNAITSAEEPYVFTIFPFGRTSQVSARVVLPEFDGAAYRCKLGAQFLAPASAQSSPLITAAVLIPSPAAAGVTPVEVDFGVFPAFPTTIVAGNMYYVESSLPIDLSLFSRGVLSYTLQVETPNPALRMLNTGIRLYMED